MERLCAFIVLLLSVFSSLSVNAQVYTTYYHNDHLGSPVAATDERNELLWRAHYRPYGERQENPRDVPYGSRGYTGHVQDSSSGLVYMQARYYDPVVGRFLSIDPEGPQDGVPGSFNRYAYALNNPYRYVDPDGRNPLLIIFGGVTAGAGMMTHADFANAPAEGEVPQRMGALEHLGALPGLQVSKGWHALGVAKRNSKDAIPTVVNTAKASVGPFFKTTKEAAEAAKALGFKRLKERINGQTIFRKGNNYISRDVDGHNGGAWKMADSVRDLASKETRSGTFSADLTRRIGD